MWLCSLLQVVWLCGNINKVKIIRKRHKPTGINLWDGPFIDTCLNLYRSFDFSWKLSSISSLCKFSTNVSLPRKFLMMQWGKGWQSNSRSPAHNKHKIIRQLVSIKLLCGKITPCCLWKDSGLQTEDINWTAQKEKLSNSYRDSYKIKSIFIQVGQVKWDQKILRT